MKKKKYRGIMSYKQRFAIKQGNINKANYDPRFDIPRMTPLDNACGCGQIACLECSEGKKSI